MHFRFNNKIYSTDIVMTVSIIELTGRKTSSEGWPWVRLVFFFHPEADLAPKHIVTDMKSMNQFFYDWEIGRRFFTFYLTEDDLDMQENEAEHDTARSN